MKKKVIAYLHTHWDREWYESKEEFNLRLLDVFDEVLEELVQNRAPSFYFDGQVSALEDYLQFRPEKKQLIKKLIKEKKLFIGPFYVSSDSFLVSSNLMEKNLKIGINFAKKLGQKEFIGYIPDSFGHSADYSTLLQKFGINKAILWRGIGEIPADFIHNGIKTTWLPQGYFFDILHTNLDIFKKAELTENTLDKIAKFSGNTLLLPVGADHLKILTDATNKIKEINKYLKKYEIILSNPFEYFNLVEHKIETQGEFLDNSISYILGGVYSARVREKIKNAELMWKLSKITEPLNKITKSNFKKNIEFATKKLIKNHAHDSIYGCSKDIVNKAVSLRFDSAGEILEGVNTRIIKKFETPKENEIGVINLSGNKPSYIKFNSSIKMKNTQIISKKMGFPTKFRFDKSIIPITEDNTIIYEQIAQIKSTKKNKYIITKPEKPIKSTEIALNKLENKFIKITIKNSKINVLNKTTGELFKDFIVIKNTKDSGDSYNYAPADSGEILKLQKTKIIEDGKIRSKLRLYFKFLELDLILSNNSKNIEFEAKIKNNEKNHKLQIQFNLKENIIETLTDDLYKPIKRYHNPEYKLFENQPAPAKTELQTNSYPMQKWVVAQGLGIFTVGLNEYEIYKNTISVSLLRAIGIISNPKNPARYVPAGPPIEIPEAQELGETREKFTVSFCTEKECERISEELYGTYLVKTADY